MGTSHGLALVFGELKNGVDNSVVGSLSTAVITGPISITKIMASPSLGGSIRSTGASNHRS